MAIKFEHKGVKWETDTAEEAIKLQEQLEERDQGHATRMSPWALGTIWDLLKGVGEAQNALLEVMATKLWITSTELIEQLGPRVGAIVGRCPQWSFEAAPGYGTDAIFALPDQDRLERKKRKCAPSCWHRTSRQLLRQMVGPTTGRGLKRDDGAIRW